MTLEELQRAIDEIASAIHESELTWADYAQKFDHDFHLINDSGQAMRELQEFRHKKAAHYRQIAAAKAELLGLKLAANAYF
jgi:hypothetical protein